MCDLGIEHLPGELARLVEHFAAVAGVGVVTEIRALIDEAFTPRVHHDAEGIGVFLEVVAHIEVAEFRCIHVPPDRVTA